jgi:hypothetical protein
MPLPLQASEKAGIIRRAKALGVLLLPFIAFAAVVFLSFSLQSRLGTPRKNQPAQPSADGPMSVTVENGPTPAEGQVATGTHTKVTTYTITGSY